MSKLQHSVSKNYPIHTWMHVHFSQEMYTCHRSDIVPYQFWGKPYTYIYICNLDIEDSYMQHNIYYYFKDTDVLSQMG